MILTNTIQPKLKQENEIHSLAYLFLVGAQDSSQPPVCGLILKMEKV